MKTRFILELFIGLLGISAVLFWGSVGSVVLAALVVLPFIKKRKVDERETQLLYKTGNLTAVVTLLFAVVINNISQMKINGNVIGDNWLMLLVFIFILAHGAAGLFYFSKE
jgi:hypothetical protein